MTRTTCWLRRRQSRRAEVDQTCHRVCHVGMTPYFEQYKSFHCRSTDIPCRSTDKSKSVLRQGMSSVLRQGVLSSEFPHCRRSSQHRKNHSRGGMCLAGMVFAVLGTYSYRCGRFMNDMLVKTEPPGEDEVDSIWEVSQWTWNW